MLLDVCDTQHVTEGDTKRFAARFKGHTMLDGVHLANDSECLGSDACSILAVTMRLDDHLDLVTLAAR